jgi:CheY-like chemotaxis protein
MAKIEEGALEVLIVDDMPQTRQILRHVLRSIGYQRVQEAGNVADAYSQIRRQCPDIVLTDWDMPGSTGIELIKAVRRRTDSPDPLLPIILITSHGSIEYVTASRDAGATHFLVKPFSPARLRERIQDVAVNERPFIVAPGYRGPDRRRTDRPVALDRRSPTGVGAGVTILPPDGMLLAKIQGDATALAEALRKRTATLRQLFGAAPMPAATAAASAGMSKAASAGMPKKALISDPGMAGLENLIDHAMSAASNYTAALARISGPLAQFGAEQEATMPPSAARLVGSLQRILADPTGARADPKIVELHLQALKAMLRTELDPSGLAVAHELASEIDGLARASAGET